MKKIIALDMDGTIADLYNVKDWLPKLITEDPTPYIDAMPLVDMQQLNTVCILLQRLGWSIQIITATSKNATESYKTEIKKAKISWLNKWEFIPDYLSVVDYTTNKNNVIKKLMKKNDIAILIDDEERHRKEWKWGKTINPITTNIIDELYKFIECQKKEGYKKYASKANLLGIKIT